MTLTWTEPDQACSGGQTSLTELSIPAEAFQHAEAARYVSDLAVIAVAVDTSGVERWRNVAANVFLEGNFVVEDAAFRWETEPMQGVQRMVSADIDADGVLEVIAPEDNAPPGGRVAIVSAPLDRDRILAEEPAWNGDEGSSFGVGLAAGGAMIESRSAILLPAPDPDPDPPPDPRERCRSTMRSSMCTPSPWTSSISQKARGSTRPATRGGTTCGHRAPPLSARRSSMCAGASTSSRTQRIGPVRSSSIASWRCS